MHASDSFYFSYSSFFILQLHARQIPSVVRRSDTNHKHNHCSDHKRRNLSPASICQYTTDCPAIDAQAYTCFTKYMVELLPSHLGEVLLQHRSVLQGNLRKHIIMISCCPSCGYSDCCKDSKSDRIHQEH